MTRDAAAALDTADPRGRALYQDAFLSRLPVPVRRRVFRLPAPGTLAT